MLACVKTLNRLVLRNQKARISRSFSTEEANEELRKKRIYEKLIRDKVDARVEEDFIKMAQSKEWRKGVCSGVTRSPT